MAHETLGSRLTGIKPTHPLSLENLRPLDSEHCSFKAAGPGAMGEIVVWTGSNHGQVTSHAISSTTINIGDGS